MRKEPRMTVPLDEAIDATLCDMVARGAPAMLKARVLARLGDEVIDATLGDIAAREVPATLATRVMARLAEDPAEAGTARERRWAFAQPLLRPAIGLTAAVLVTATALTVWVARSPNKPTSVGAPAGQPTNQSPAGSGASTSHPVTMPPSGPSVPDRGASPIAVLTDAGTPRGSRPAPHAVVTRVVKGSIKGSDVTPWSVAADSDDLLVITPLAVDPIPVSEITISPIEVTPVEISPPASGPPGGTR